jgi:hypothetical protein
MSYLALLSYEGKVNFYLVLGRPYKLSSELCFCSLKYLKTVVDNV